ncbi:MAG: hypothetical protein OEV94_07020 [Deltaproteobacteria bacterium]|nr:hypothetical protein [Deltaproteobacteria bacterium]
MNRISLKKLFLGVALTGMAALLVGCETYYQFPADSEPYALLKVRFSYGDRDISGDRISGYVRLSNQPDEAEKLGLAYDDDGRSGFKRAMSYIPFFGNAFEGRSKPLRMDVIRIKPGKNIYLWATLEEVWNENVGRTTIIHTDSCPTKVKFHPEAKKMYVLLYKTKNVRDTCSAQLYVEKPNGQGGYTLEETGERVERRER